MRTTRGVYPPKTKALFPPNLPVSPSLPHSPPRYPRRTRPLGRPSTFLSVFLFCFCGKQLALEASCICDRRSQLPLDNFLHDIDASLCQVTVIRASKFQPKSTYKPDTSSQLKYAHYHMADSWHIPVNILT